LSYCLDLLVKLIDQCRIETDSRLYQSLADPSQRTDIEHRIENLTYELGDDIEYGLRMALGALGGLSIGWFLALDQLAGFQSLSPLALSFIVGYNIDMLFSLMDRFIEAFSTVHVSTSSEVPKR